MHCIFIFIMNNYHMLFMLKNEFLRIKYPILVISKPNSKVGNLPKNRFVDLQSFIGENFRFRIRVKKSLKPPSFLDFSTILLHNLEEAQQLVLILKITFSVLETPPAPIFRLLGTSQADWNQNPKVGYQK